MRTFKVNKNTEIVCEWKKTRIAFKHEATLLIDGNERDKVKICYLNRTWERFEFESVIRKLLEKTAILPNDKVIGFLDLLAREDSESSPFKGIVAIAQLGEIFGKNLKEKNDWKARMLKAGLENQGLIMPDDWDQLDEDTKEARLNGAIAQLK